MRDIDLFIEVVCFWLILFSFSLEETSLGFLFPDCDNLKATVPSKVKAVRCWLKVNVDM